MRTDPDLPEELPIMLPRRHLSWTQMSCWRSSKDRYRREYFEKGRKLDTKYLQFGKGIASAIENGTHKEMLPDLEVFSKPEYKIEVEVGGVPLLCFLDSYEPAPVHEFWEYKTGKRLKSGDAPWNLAKVQKHDQLLFYAVALRAQTGKMPERCRLAWIETKEESVDPEDFWSQFDKKLAVTGLVKSFEREFDERELDRMEEEIVDIAEEISEAYRAFISEL